MNIIRKISIKTVVGGKKTIFENINKPLMRVFGKASSLKTGSTDWGEWTAFIGSFRAIDLTTGAEYASSKVFLPDAAEEMLLGAMGDGNPVEFAFDIGANEDESSATGYVYTVTPLLRPSEEDDPLAQLASKLPRLEGPKA